MFEIVPILDIKNSGQAKNITDVSPLHAKFVNQNAKKLKDDIRLTKAFCKALNIYGAESYIQGFSGYVIELLIIHYGSFLKLMQAAAKWKSKTIIDIKKYHKNVLFELNTAKTLSPLIIVDPVQKERNTAAALSEDKYNFFMRKAKEFLKKPSMTFFIRKKVDKEDLLNEKKKDILIVLDVKNKAGKRDVIGSKLLKSFEYISRRLDDFDFSVLKNSWDWDEEKKALFWYYVKDETLSEYKEIQGPPLSIDEHVKVFKKKYKVTSVKKDVVYATVKRKFMTVDLAVKSIVKEDYFKKKVKDVKVDVYK